MDIECIRFKSHNKNNCLGFADIYIFDLDMEIFGLSLMQKDGKRWVNFPAKLYEKDGEKKYLSYFRFRDKDNYFKFCESVKKAIDKKALEQEPSAFDEDCPI